MTPFTFNLKWKAGREMKDVDTLSRDPRYQDSFYMEDTIQGYCIGVHKERKEDYDTSPLTGESESEICFMFVEDEVPIEHILGHNPAYTECYLGKTTEQISRRTKKKADALQLDKEIQNALFKHTSSFVESQRKDPETRKIVDDIDKGRPKPHFSLREDGVLLYDDRVVIPEHERPLILWMMHDHPLSGHIGEKKLLKKLTSRYFWPGMIGTVKKYLAKCSCRKSKARKATRVGKTIVFSHYGPLECLQFDLVGPFPLSNRRNQYWLTLIDRYTRYVEFIPLPNSKATTVARAIYTEWITRFGCPTVLMSDNEFRSDIQRELSLLVGAKQIFTAPYKPSTNGLCERVHGFVQQILQNSIAGEEGIRDWDDHLPAIRFSIITSSLDGLGFSPYELLYGRKARLPVDLMIPRDSGVAESEREYYATRWEEMRRIRDLFEYNQSKVDARMRWFRDKSQRRRPTEFKVGDWVYHTRPYYNQEPGQRGLTKLLGKFCGPSQIIKQLGPNTYEVQVDEKTTRTFNVEYLAQYKGEEPPLHRSRPVGSALDLVVPNGGGEGGVVLNGGEDANSEVDRPPVQDNSPAAFKNLGERVAGEHGATQEAKSVAIESTEQKDSKQTPDALPSPVVNHADDFVWGTLKRKKPEVPSCDPPPEKKRRETDLLSTERKESNSESFVGQWILACEDKPDQKASGKGKRVTLTMAKVISMDGNTEIAQSYQPKGIRKKIFFLPLWYKYTNPESTKWTTKASDRTNLTEEWLPWTIELGEQWKLVARSKRDETGESPPLRFQEHYKRVWDRKISESDPIVQ